MKTDILMASQPFALQHAVDVLQHSGLVAFPTDTVYGLAALPFNDDSVQRLYVVKGRSSSKAIAVLISDVAELSEVTHNPTQLALRLADRFWPGPLTLVVPKHPDLPELVSPLPTVGVRIPDHPVALELLRMAGPLAVTSANLSGQQSANSAQEVFDQLQDRIHLILDGGRTPGNVPSTVVDCTADTPVILRHGPITMEQLLAASP